MEIGLVGLPNAGKSTLFNALTIGNALCEKYPFTTIQPNLGYAILKDERLEILAKRFNQEKVTPAAIKVFDIAGLIKGSSSGLGLGNQFLSHIRSVDATAFVLRGFENPEVPNTLGRIDFVEEFEILTTELILSDLQFVLKNIENLKPKAKTEGSGKTEFKSKLAILEKIHQLLDKNSLLINSNDEDIIQVAKGISLLTVKPFICIINVDDNFNNFKSQIDNFFSYSQNKNIKTVIVNSKLENELNSFDSEQERNSYRKEMGFELYSITKVIENFKNVLNLISFFTVVGKEARHWLIPEGKTIIDAANMIHSDIAKGFIKAEVFNFSDLDKIRIEGRDYKLKDGDVIDIKFHP